MIQIQLKAELAKPAEKKSTGRGTVGIQTATNSEMGRDENFLLLGKCFQMSAISMTLSIMN